MPAQHPSQASIALSFRHLPDATGASWAHEQVHPGGQSSEHPAGETLSGAGVGSQGVSVPAFHLLGRQFRGPQGSRAPPAFL